MDRWDRLPKRKLYTSTLSVSISTRTLPGLVAMTDYWVRLPVTRYIVGDKKEESDALLKFLYDHIALSQDLQIRVRWRPGTAVVWDVSRPDYYTLKSV